MVPPFIMGTTSSTTMQSLGEIEQRASAVGAKIWCLSLCFLSVTLRNSLNRHCVAIYWPISTRFSAFFRRDCSFRYTT